MKTSQKGINLICQFEGCVLTAYKPINTEKYYTIGYGHYGADVYAGMTITKDEAVELLKKDIAKFEMNVNFFNDKYHYKFNQNEFDALVSFAFNIGSINQLCKEGKRTKAQISECMPLYCRGAGGIYLDGLHNRRLKEQFLFNSPVIESFFDNKNISKNNILPVGEYSKGCEGEEVRLIQKALQRLGYIINCTGRYNDTTVNRIKALQTTSGYLVIDGIYGKSTREYMIKMLEGGE